MNISFTLSTVPLLALAAYLIYRAKGQLLPVVMFMSIFQAASVINIGGEKFGIGPSYLLLLAAVGMNLGSRRRGRNNCGKPLSSATLLLTLFVTYATASAVVNPFVFKGVLITNPKIGFNVPLEWETGHLNQLVYLLISFALYRVAAYKTTPAELTKSLNWFVGGVVLASGVAIYQYLAMKTGLPFPSDFLYTNPGYTIYNAYEINGFSRVNATFTEASSAAFSLTIGLALVLWRLLSGAVSLRNIFHAVVIAFGLLLTLSTTGYLCLVYLAAIAGWFYVVRWKGSSDSRAAKIFLAIPAVAFVVVLSTTPASRETLSKLTHTVLLDKTESSSYQERSQVNENAIRTAAATYGLGAGWGICRGSSFIPTALGNVGIPGLALFVGFCCTVLWPALRLGKVRLPLHGAVLFALSAVLVELAVSAPEVMHPIIWLLFAVGAKMAATRPVAVVRKMAIAEAPPRREGYNSPALSLD